MNSSDFNLMIWQHYINEEILFFSSFGLIPTGILFNLIQIMVLFRKRFLYSIMAFYYRLISIYNIIILILTWFYLMSKLSLHRIDIINDLGCKLFSFFFRTTYQITSWLNVFVTLDRLLFIIFPTRFKFIKNKRNIFIIFLIAHSIFMIINIPNFFIEWIHKKTNISNSTIETELCSADPAVFILREAISQIIGTFAPFILMLNLNSLLIYKVLKSRHRLKNDEQMGKEIYFAFTLIGSNILFLISFVPFSIYSIILTTYMFDEYLLLIPSINSYISLFETITRSIYCLNYSLTLIIQIALNKKFRKDFYQMLNNFVLKIRNKPRVSTTVSSNSYLH